MKERFKVALVSSGLGRELRGIETWMADLALHLPDTLQVEVWSGGSFVSPRPDRVVRRIFGINRNHSFLRGRSWSSRYLAEQNTALPGTLIRLLLHRPDVAYCGDPALAWHLKRFRRWHGCPIVFLNGMRLSPLWAACFDGVHVLAPPYLAEAADLMPGRSLEHFFSIPHSVDAARFHPVSPGERRATRHAFGLPEEGFIVLTIGPMGTASGKRIDHVASEVARASSTAFLVAAGADEEGADGVRSRVQEALGSRAILLGRVARERMPLLHQAADVFALGTLGEPFSIAIAEALATGNPVVHHDDPVTNWVASSGGIPVAMNMQGAAAAAFRRLETDPDYRAELGLAGRRLAEERYAPEQVCAGLEREFRRIAARGKGT